MQALLSALMVILTGFIHGGNVPAQVHATQEEQVEATITATPTGSVTPTVIPSVTPTTTVTPTVAPTVTPSTTPKPSIAGAQEETHENEQAKVHEHEGADNSADTSINFGAQVSAFVHSLHIGGQANTDVEKNN